MPCPNCGYSEIEDRCEVHGCKEPAHWEGWWRVTDHLGVATGLLQRRNVCDLHRLLLIGGDKEGAVA